MSSLSENATFALPVPRVGLAAYGAAQVLECGPLSVRATRQAATRGFAEPSLEAAIRNQRDYPALRTLFASQDYVEGPLAFAQKRKPVWRGA